MYNKLKMLVAVFALTIIVGCSTDSEIIDQPDQNIILENNSNEIKDQYIVVLNEGTLSRINNVSRTKNGYKAVVQELKNEIPTKFSKIKSENIKQTFGFALQGFVATLTESQVIALQNDPRVKSIEKDYVVTLGPPPGKGPGSGGGGGGTDPSQATPYGITRVNGGVDGTGLRAWIIDSGIDLDHPDLNVNTNLSETFVTTGKDSRSADDGNGHGTHVAGTVAAIDNGYGVIGVAAGAEVVALKVLDSRGSGSFSWTITALDYVHLNGASGDAVNMSLGPRSRYTDSAVDDAVKKVAQKGIKVAIAAGNSDDDASFYSPARTNGNNIFTISAIDNNDDFASFSNYGSPVDYAAPGVGVLSTYKNGGYATLSGTSMASPHVCGILLLGNIRGDGFANGDPDGNPDPIAVH